MRTVFGRLRGDQLVGFAEEEFCQCVVATERAVDVARTVAAELWLVEDSDG